MKTEKIIIGILAVVIFLASIVGALAVTYNLASPTNYASSNSTTVYFNWSFTDSVEKNMTSRLMLSAANNESLIYLNTSKLCLNATQCNVTLSSLGTGMYKWYINSTKGSNSSLPVVVSANRWFEVRSNPSGEWLIFGNGTNQAMALQKNTGDLNITGTLKASSISTSSVTATNFTANWFFGAFNWAIGADSLGYLQFNGTQLNYNESKTNVTINEIASVYNSSMKSYVDAQDSEYNTSNNNYITTKYDKTGGTINGDVVIVGNLTVVGSAIEANVTNMNINGSIKPTMNNAFDLGSGAAMWQNGFIINTNATTITAQNGNNIGIIGNLTPQETNKYDLGHSGGNIWKTISGGLLNINDIIASNQVNATRLNGNSSWVHQSYPNACPANSAITQLGDSVVCTDGLYTLSNIATALGNWSADKPSYATKAELPSGHTHDTANITSGTFDIARLPALADTHTHAGENITNGTIADARIASTIARDSELSSYLPLAGGTMTGNLTIGDPTNQTGLLLGTGSITWNGTAIVIKVN